MHKCYHRLAYHERCQIRVLLSQGFSMRSIARDLGRSPATISREIARNREGRGPCRQARSSSQATTVIFKLRQYPISGACFQILLLADP